MEKSFPYFLTFFSIVSDSELNSAIADLNLKANFAKNLSKYRITFYRGGFQSFIHLYSHVPLSFSIKKNIVIAVP